MVRMIRQRDRKALDVCVRELSEVLRLHEMVSWHESVGGPLELWSSLAVASSHSSICSSFSKDSSLSSAGLF